jgi:hypothetical protein
VPPEVNEYWPSPDATVASVTAKVDAWTFFSAVETPPRSALDRSTVMRLAASPSAPTWNFMLDCEPSSSFVPLKFTEVLSRESSSVIEVASVEIAERASSLFESFAAWTARSRSRPRRDCACVRAPLLMRRPLESFAREFESEFCTPCRFLYVLSASRLVLMLNPI